MAQLYGKWGYIDKTGKFVIEPIFDIAFSFNEGLAPVYLKQKNGYIDKSGTFVITTIFEDIWGFNEGLARVWLKR